MPKDSKAKTHFLKLLSEYRTKTEESYSAMLGKEQKAKLDKHEKKRDDLGKAFKKMIREASLNELAECLDELMKKWQIIYDANHHEVIAHAQKGRGDFVDIQKIVNAVSKRKKKTSLFKQVEACSLIRVALLITKCAGLIDIGVKDSSGSTCLDCAERMSREKKGTDRERAAVMFKFLKAVHEHDLDPSNMDVFDEIAYTFAKEALIRDYPVFSKKLHDSAQRDSIKSFKEACAKITHDYIFNMLPFTSIVDSKDDQGKTSLQVALERPKDSPDRVEIARWLLLHQASPFHLTAFQKEAEDIQNELSGITLEEEEERHQQMQMIALKPRRASMRVQRVARDAKISRIDADKKVGNEEKEEEEEEEEKKKIEEEKKPKEEDEVEEKTSNQVCEDDGVEEALPLKKQTTHRNIDDGPRDTICSGCVMM